MSATKEFNHDEIESQSRQYDILELQKMTMEQLNQIAIALNIHSLNIAFKQAFIYAILEKQQLS
jgi:hypothetical protein